jgi:hypothetical protein
MTTESSFRTGIVLFNDGAFWHAHEQWEDCWRLAQEPEATLYKGLIQAAAALVHWQRGNPVGVRRNWYKARPHLVAVASLPGALDLTRFITQMDTFVMAQANQRSNVSQLVPTLSFR